MAAKAGKVNAELAALARLDRAALRERWRELYGTEAPARLSPEMLRKAIAYRLQENAFGGLKPATRKRLRRIAEGAEPVGEGPRPLKPGTTLVRQWHGETHEVWVLETGYAWRGGHYRSLSRIAREITGARWNGPAFFGLRSARVMEAAEWRCQSNANQSPRSAGLRTSGRDLPPLGQCSGAVLLKTSRRVRWRW